MSARIPVRALVTVVIEAESQAVVRDYAAGALRGDRAPLPGDGLHDKLAALLTVGVLPGITVTVDSVNALLVHQPPRSGATLACGCWTYTGVYAGQAVGDLGECSSHGEQEIVACNVDEVVS